MALLDVDFAAAGGASQTIGTTALPVVCDVTDAQSVRTAFDTIAKHFGGVDIVVSNAGRPGKAASARSTKTSCAKALN